MLWVVGWDGNENVGNIHREREGRNIEIITVEMGLEPVVHVFLFWSFGLSPLHAF